MGCVVGCGVLADNDHEILGATLGLFGYAFLGASIGRNLGRG